MVYQERNVWSTLIATAITVPIYIVIVLVAAGGGPLTDVDWVPILLWTMGASIVASIVISIVWGILAGMRDPHGVGTSDQRDRDISRFGSRIGYGILVARGPRARSSCAHGRSRLVLDRATRSSSASRSRTFVGDIARRDRVPAGHRLMVKPTKVTNSIRAAARAGRTHPGRAREPRSASRARPSSRSSRAGTRRPSSSRSRSRAVSGWGWTTCSSTRLRTDPDGRERRP